MGAHTLALSNLSKVLFADGFTKGEVIDYYLRVAEVLLAHVAGRVITRVRFPAGAAGKSFFERNAPAGAPAWLAKQAVIGSRSSIQYVLADSAAALVYLANLAAVELHAPQWVVPGTGAPIALTEDTAVDRLMIDLDPGVGAEGKLTARAALLAAMGLTRAGLVPFAKTSGSKGLQICAPVTDTSAKATFAFAKALGAELAKEHPDLFVATMSLDARVGKVYLDYSQNLPSRNTVVAYSMRMGPTPRISTPVTWEEVAAAADGQALSFGPSEVLARLESGDLWDDLLTGEFNRSLQ